jgi:hypothetical protein
MSYLKYSNLCAAMVRDALKPNLKAAAKAREVIHFKNVTYKDGKTVKQGLIPRACLVRSVCIPNNWP